MRHFAVIFRIAKYRTKDFINHYFLWSAGRRLSEYQILFIARVNGVFETEITDSRKINVGAVWLVAL